MDRISELAALLASEGPHAVRVRIAAEAAQNTTPADSTTDEDAVMQRYGDKPDRTAEA